MPFYLRVIAKWKEVENTLINQNFFFLKLHCLPISKLNIDMGCMQGMHMELVKRFKKSYNEILQHFLSIWESSDLIQRIFTNQLRIK